MNILGKTEMDLSRVNVNQDGHCIGEQWAAQSVIFENFWKYPSK